MTAGYTRPIIVVWLGRNISITTSWTTTPSMTTSTGFPISSSVYVNLPTPQSFQEYDDELLVGR